MQAKMKQFQLSEQRVEEILMRELVGRIGTLGADGYPYVTPVHYVLLDGRIYIHGLAAGEKIANIRANAKVGFEVDTMHSLVQREGPCDTGTCYESVIIKGKASLVEDVARKIAVLDAVVRQFSPQHAGAAFPQNMLKMTAVIEIVVESRTGKCRT